MAVMVGEGGGVALGKAESMEEEGAIQEQAPATAFSINGEKDGHTGLAVCRLFCCALGALRLRVWEGRGKRMGCW